MTHKEAAEQIERSVGLLKEAAEGISSALPALTKEAYAAEEGRSRLDETSRMLMEAEAQISTIGKSLESIESAVTNAMEAARAFIHDQKRSLDTRLEMLELCRKVFDPLKSAGFEVVIPQIGEQLSVDKHQPKGRAKSELGEGQVADVISWGYSFPSGAGQLAHVLVGDGSLSEKPEEEPAPAAPTTKAGISMVLEEEPAEAPKKKKSARPGDSLFDSLAEAAERNRENRA